jgi:hypothetical protein
MLRSSTAHVEPLQVITGGACLLTHSGVTMHIAQGPPPPRQKIKTQGEKLNDKKKNKIKI